jgi:hypothetical protein
MQKLSACYGLRSRSIGFSIAQIPPSTPRSSTTPSPRGPAPAHNSPQPKSPRCRRRRRRRHRCCCCCCWSCSTTSCQQPHLPLARASKPQTTTSHKMPTLFFGDLEPWMDEYHLIQVCGLLCWDTVKMRIPRLLVAANATRHPNYSGYALLIMATPQARPPSLPLIWS